jgi:lipopolysaccharide export system permease protein
MRQLDVAIDSIKKENGQFYKKVKQEAMPSLMFVPLLDSTNWKRLDTPVTAKNFRELFPDSIYNASRSGAISKIEAMRSSNEVLLSQYKDQRKSLRQHQIEWHRKISLSAACLVLFLIGAPLGSIIRKGGLGSPLVFSIVFFMVFYFLSTTGEKFAKEGSTTPFIGMWLSTFVLVPIGIFLITKALNDSQIFNKEAYSHVWRSVRSLWKKS